MNLTRKLTRAKSLSFKDWKLLAEVTMALFSARLVFARLSAHDLIKHLSADSLPGTALSKSDEDLGRLAWAIAAAANVLPWRTDCLIRCLAAKTLLQRRNLAGQFHIGVTKPEDGALAAHAWMSCGNISIAGGDGTEFAPLVTPDTVQSTG